MTAAGCRVHRAEGAEAPQLAQLDGDPVGEVRGLRMRVDPGALLVRV